MLQTLREWYPRLQALPFLLIASLALAQANDKTAIMIVSMTSHILHLSPLQNQILNLRLNQNRTPAALVKAVTKTAMAFQTTKRVPQPVMAVLPMEAAQRKEKAETNFNPAAGLHTCLLSASA